MTARLSINVHQRNWLGSNDRRHWAATAGLTKSVRSMAAMAARGNRITPIDGPVSITALIGYPTARRADPHNAAPTVKAAIDGVVDAKVLPEDHSGIVRSVTFERDPQKSLPYHNRLTLIITKIAEDTTP